MGEVGENDEDSKDEFDTLIIFTTLFFIFSGIFKLVKDIKQPKNALLRESLEIAVWSFLWFGFSVSLVIYNKWLVTSWKGGFRFPFIMSTTHMVLKLCLVLLIAHFSTNFPIPKLKPGLYIYNAIPIGITTALDIAASNESYLFVSVPFYTVVKSSSLIFVLLFSIVFKLQPFETRLIVVVFVITLGIALAVSSEVHFSLKGFFLILAASALGGFRWSLTQLFMNKLKGKLDSLLTIYFISPASALTLLPFSLIFEGKSFTESKFASNIDLFLLAFMNLLGAGVFAFLMIFVELKLIKKTSSLTMAIISYFKQFMQIILSSLVFKTKLSILNILGLFITILGTFYYSYMKLSKVDEKLSPILIESDDENEDELSLSTSSDSENHQKLIQT